MEAITAFSPAQSATGRFEIPARTRQPLPRGEMDLSALTFLRACLARCIVVPPPLRTIFVRELNVIPAGPFLTIVRGRYHAGDDNGDPPPGSCVASATSVPAAFGTFLSRP